MGEPHRVDFISQFTKSKIVSFEFHGAEGKMWLGGNRKKHPKSDFVLYMQPPPFYCVDVFDVRSDSVSARDNNALPSRGLVFDTGSNMLDLPPKLFDLVFPLLEQDKPIEFIFEAAHIFLKMTFDANQYRWDGGALLIEKGTDPVHVVMGSLFMNKMRFTFDPDRNECGISRLP